MRILYYPQPGRKLQGHSGFLAWLLRIFQDFDALGVHCDRLYLQLGAQEWRAPLAEVSAIQDLGVLLLYGNKLSLENSLNK